MGARAEQPTDCGASRPTVSEYLRRLAEAGLSWPLPEDMGEPRLELLLFPPKSTVTVLNGWKKAATWFCPIQGWLTRRVNASKPRLNQPTVCIILSPQISNAH
jgi:hypothetical protein